MFYYLSKEETAKKINHVTKQVYRALLHHIITPHMNNMWQGRNFLLC